MEHRSAGDDPWHIWEEMPPPRAAGGKGGPAVLLGQEAGDTNPGLSGLIGGRTKSFFPPSLDLTLMLT